MNLKMLSHVYPPYRLRPDRELARKFMSALGADETSTVLPATYLIFLRGESRGVNLFKDLDIPRERALHGGQRYEWFSPMSFDDEFLVTARVEAISEKTGKRGKIWFADVGFEYRRVQDDGLALRELTRLIKMSSE